MPRISKKGPVYKEGSVWRARFELPRSPDGTRNQRNRKFPTAAAANAYYRQEMAKGGQPASGYVLDDLLELYKDSQKLRKASTTYSTAEKYRNHIRPYFNDTPIDRIDAPAVERWLRWMLDRRKPDGSSYADETINHAIDALSVLFNTALKMRIVSDNPVKGLDRIHRPDKAGRNSAKANYWEKSQFDEFMEYVDSDYWRLAFQFLFETGMREGEFLALRWQDLDLRSGEIEINGSMTPKDGSVRGSTRTAPKNGKSRTIIVSPDLLDDLRAYSITQKNQDGFNPGFYVFGDIAPRSRNFLATNLDKFITKAKEDDGRRWEPLPRITPHGLRHSCASYMIDQGLQDDLIADYLGHSVAMLHKTYKHIYRRKQHEFINKKAEIFKR